MSATKRRFLSGFFRGLQFFPGISRLGITLAVCLMCGFNKKFAMKYAFLAAVPSIFRGGCLGAYPGFGLKAFLETFGVYIVGAAVAGFVGYFSIQIMLRMLKRRKFIFFAVYCFLIGTVAAICNFVLIEGK